MEEVGVVVLVAAEVVAVAAAEVVAVVVAHLRMPYHQ
jgi:hypothetical protein